MTKRSHDLNTYLLKSLASTEDEGDNITEMMNQLKEMRNLLSAIWNTSIYDSNLEEIRFAETERQNKLFEIVFYIQKLARELITIASANKEKKKELPESTLDSQLIEKLSKLYKVMKRVFFINYNNMLFSHKVPEQHTGIGAE